MFGIVMDTLRSNGVLWLQEVRNVRMKVDVKVLNMVLKWSVLQSLQSGWTVETFSKEERGIFDGMKLMDFIEYSSDKLCPEFMDAVVRRMVCASEHDYSACNRERSAEYSKRKKGGVRYCLYCCMIEEQRGREINDMIMGGFYEVIRNAVPRSIKLWTNKLNKLPKI